MPAYAFDLFIHLKNTVSKRFLLNRHSNKSLLGGEETRLRKREVPHLFLPMILGTEKQLRKPTNCDFSPRLHARPLWTPTKTPGAGVGEGAHLVEVGHRHQADWGPQSGSEAGPGPPRPKPTRHRGCRRAETVSLDHPDRSGTKEVHTALPTCVSVLVRGAVAPAQRRGVPVAGRWEPGVAGGDARRRSCSTGIQKL